MTNVDQFESVFRAAVKEVYVPRPVVLRRLLVVHDLDAAAAEAFLERVRRFLAVLGPGVEWTVASAAELGDLGGLLAGVEERAPDLVCTYRALGTDDWRFPFTLGARLDVLTQVTPFPILVLPHPRDAAAWPDGPPRLDAVMALTDHLAGDGRLVDWAHRFLDPADGESLLLLAHIEDEAVFERYMDAVSKVPSIDTELAREALRERLLKDPADYIASIRAALEVAGERVRTEGLVRMGHHLAEVRELVRAHHVELLVMNTNDEDQLAMHGLAYPLAVELRDVALLLL